MEKRLLLDGTMSLVTSSGFLLHPYNGLGELHHKYIKREVLQKLATKEVVTILDVGFGFGYLSALFVSELWKLNPLVMVKIIGIEKYSEVLEKITTVVPINSCHEKIISCLKENKEDAFVLVHTVDIREGITRVGSDWGDVVFFDLYPPMHNKDVWSFEVFSNIHQKMKSGGVLLTHTADPLVRLELEKAGFVWDEVRPCGRFGPGTIAHKL